MQIKTSLYTKIIGIIIIAALIITLGILFKRCNQNTNIIIAGKQETKDIYIKNAQGDSVTISKQLFNILQSQKDLLSSNLDQLIIDAIKKGNISPKEIVGWQQTATISNREIKLTDSLKNVFTNLIRLQKEFELSTSSTTLTLAEKNEIIRKYQLEQEKLFKTRVYFKDSTKYRYLAGNVGLDNTLIIDKESITSEPFVIIGKEKTLLNLGKPKYTVLVGDKNPLFKRDSLYSTTFTPKQKLQLSLGPVVLANKNQATAGAGVNIKKGIFSLTLGYQVATFKIK